MNIRNATIEDIQAITKVEMTCFPKAEAATEEDFRNRLRVYPNHFWLLEDDKKLVSFINGMVTNEDTLTDEMYENVDLHNENGQWQMIFGVNTIPEYRRQGCAEKLMRKVISDAKDQGRKGLVLTCKDRLVHYYEKFRFKNEGISDSTHGGAIWYNMRLTL